MAYIKFEKVKLKSGVDRWEGYAEGPPHPVTGKRQQIRRRGKTQNEVKTKILSRLREIEEGTYDVSRTKKIKFKQVAAKWLEFYATTGVKRGSVRIREKEVNILNRYMGDIPIANITYSFYQDFINEISKKYARTTVQGVNIAAGMIFRYAMKDKLITQSPNFDVVIPKKRKTIEEVESNPIEQKYLDSEELNEFLDAVLKYGLDLDIERFHLLAFTGMRSGELCALKWSDINFNDRTIRITKTLYNENNNMREYELTTPKTASSIRVIDVEEEIIDLLRSHRKRQLRILESYRNEFDDYHDGNFVFCRPNGYPFIQKNISTRMQRILEYTNITKKATPHIFRHTHISLLTEAGVDLATIMERVGHDDPQTTLEIYTHVTNKMKKEASDKVRFTFGDMLKKIKINKM